MNDDTHQQEQRAAAVQSTVEDSPGPHIRTHKLRI